MKHRRKNEKHYFDPNHEYFSTAKLTRYENEWVAISGRRVVAHGKNAGVVFRKARKVKPKANISLAKVLPKKPLILSFLHGQI